MPALLDTIRSEMTTAMRERDAQRRDTLRLLIAALDNARIAAGRELSDDDAIVALQREAKQRRESIDEYRKGARDDLAEAEQAELVIIEAYLPSQLGEDELRAMAQEVIAERGEPAVTRGRGRLAPRGVIDPRALP